MSTIVCNYNLEDARLRMQKLDERIKKIEDLEANRGKLLSAIIDLKLACEEARLAFDEYDYQNVIDAIMDNIATISNTEDIEQYNEAMDSIDMSFSEIIDVNIKECSQVYDMSNSFIRKFVNKTNLDKDNLEAIFDSVNSNNRDVNVYVPDCNTGQHFLGFKDKKPNYKLYGMTSQETDAPAAKEHFHKVAIGKFLGTRISNDVFDMMLIDPSIKYHEDGTITRFGIDHNEDEYLRKSTKYLRQDGVLFFTIPFFRVTRDIATYISRNYKDVQVIKLSKRDFAEGKKVLISGVKKKDRETCQETYDKVRSAYDIDNIPSMIDEDLVKRNLPLSMLEIDTFRGSILDKEELGEIVLSTGLIDKFLIEDSKEETIDEVEPLLPFNLGQVGLVLTSGCLDGVVSKDGQHKHIIKGRVVKTKETVETNKNKSKVVEETTSNKIEINMFLPDGTYQSLA